MSSYLKMYICKNIGLVQYLVKFRSTEEVVGGDTVRRRSPLVVRLKIVVSK